MQTTLTDRQIYYFRVLSMTVLLAGAACYVVFTIHWQWMWDTQVMHYIVLLLNHGKVPYKDIYDINMPGAYLTERWAIGIFGGGDLGWRLYEFTLLGSMTLAMIVIALPYDWLAGLFAGVLFSLQVGSMGPWQAAERDEVMTVLIFIGYAFLMLAVRKARPALMLLFGLAMGLAILIKPTVVPFALCMLLFPFFVLRRQSKSPAAYILFALAGFAIALGILLDFLLPQHALGPFLFILSKLVPYYSSLAHPTLWVLIRRSIPQAFRVYLPLALLLAIAGRSRESRCKEADWTLNWEMWAVRAGVLFGGISYFIQRKGYDYHRIALVCFGLLWIGLEFTAAMKDRGWRRNAGVAGMAFGVLFMVPFNAWKVHGQHVVNAAVPVLEQDLVRLGGDQLQGKVQCLDLVGGCYSALYRLGLVQSTGFDGDLQFFGPDDGKVVPYYRKIFWDEIHQNPPIVILLSNEWYQESSYSFNKLNTWPEFRDYLNSAYRLQTTEGPFILYGAPMEYRVYVLKGSFADQSGL
jgi:hypothetical protein